MDKPEIVATLNKLLRYVGVALEATPVPPAAVLENVHDTLANLAHAIEDGDPVPRPCPACDDLAAVIGALPPGGYITIGRDAR